MSGLFTHRVNRSWSKATANISAAVFFWEWLKYFESHLGFDFVGYGVGKTQSGTEPPAAWKDWLPHEPDLEAVPGSMGDNSWFVVEAKNADAQLDGGGSHPWQVKFQYTHATGFDDCNVADNDYGVETETYRVAVRFNAMGGWNGTTLDFAPVGGEESSDNMRIWEGQSEMFWLDIIGDDDSIYYKGAGGTSAADAKGKTRGGYMGMLQRRSSAIVVPFFCKIGSVHNGGNTSTGYRAIQNRATGSIYAFEWQSDGYWNKGIYWPSYSLWKDGTRVTNHHADNWDYDSLADVCIHPYTSEDVVPAILVAQKEDPKKHGIIGEYRLLGAAWNKYAQHVTFGENQEWIQVCANPGAGGIAVRWPEGVVPIW